MTEPTPVTHPAPLLEGTTLEEAQRRIAAAIRVLSSSGYTLSPAPEVKFTVHKPNGWAKHQVVCTVGEVSEVVERFWSWDRADDLAERLNQIRRSM